jgi:hypothetical protein
VCQCRCRLGSRSRGYHPVAPRPIAAGPLCSAFQFRPSSPEALYAKRHERSISVKDGITGDKWPVNLVCDSDFHVNHRVFLHAANLQHGTDGFTPLRWKACCGFFSPEKPDGFGRVRTRELRYCACCVLQILLA